MNDLKYQFDLRRREKDNRRMRTMDLFGEEMEDQITTMAMDVDDVDNFDILSEVGKSCRKYICRDYTF
ncbi:hypothetical protein MTR_1g045890 [Medicago truncatula]|uniref:Uncharacterized protein n=1 Tax=Medicago truncatula TaxID=3880 RepID=A0A072VHR9_MEDTR|nr:hypothetical protein MTR_1g045890 [Medicago truncatula]